MSKLGDGDMPWCIIGDFNDIISMEEKQGGSTRPRSLMAGFFEAIMDCGLHDLGFWGDLFIWERSRGQQTWVQERLDRGMAMSSWIEIFPLVEVKVLEVTTSDHLPLLLQLHRKVYVQRGRRFKFENMWLEERECRSIVQTCWSEEGTRDLMEKISRCCMRLEECGGGLIHEIKIQMGIYGKEMQRYRSRTDTSGIQKYNNAHWQYMKLLEKQEIFGRQREKQFWLRDGRLLTDNALIAYEINHYIQRKTQGKIGVVGLKVDISKAYDRLEWSFLELMMRRFKFPDAKKMEVFGFLSVRVQQRLEGWYNKELSKHGKAGARRRIGNGRDTAIWDIPWLPDVSDGYVKTPMPEQLHHGTVHDLMQEDICRRNKWVWEKINGYAFGVKAAASNLLRDWREAQITVIKDQKVAGARQWERPDAGWIKVNVDAAIFQDNSIGCGEVIRDHQGVFLAARCKKVDRVWRPREAEAISLKEALSWIVELQYKECIFETDSRTPVQAFNKDPEESFSGTIMGDCTHLLKHINSVLIQFAFRSTNRVAHTLAKAAYSMSDNEEWFVTPPSFISHVLELDVIG
ncbi:hypothetical protein AgCh_003389 [Apium graveolens]